MVVLDRGYVVGTGPLPDLLRTCPEMRRLWREELLEEAEEAEEAEDAEDAEDAGVPPALPGGAGRYAGRSR